MQSESMRQNPFFQVFMRGAMWGTLITVSALALMVGTALITG
jgi:hypothetical protein